MSQPSEAKVRRVVDAEIRELVRTVMMEQLSDCLSMDQVANVAYEVERRCDPVPDVTRLILSWRQKFGGPWLEGDPIEEFQLLNEVWNDGFEAAHTLRGCGHSRGDFRDAGYTPGKPETYKANERCVACDDVTRLLEALHGLRDEWRKFADTDHTKGMKISDARKQGQHELIMAAQSLAYATAAQRLDAALADFEGKR